MIINADNNLQKGSAYKQIDLMQRGLEYFKEKEVEYNFFSIRKKGSLKVER